MIILVDQDQVLCKWAERILEWWNHDNGTNVTIEDIESFDMKLNMGPGSEHFIRASMRYPDFYQELEPIDGALEGMHELHKRGHDVIIVTAIPRSAGVSYHGKMAWIRKYMPWFDLNNFIGCRRKEMVIGDVLLDDGPHNIEAFNKIGREAVIYDQPWNRKLPGPRVKNWKEFLEYIEAKNVL